MGFIRNYGNEQHIFHFHVMSKHMVHTYVTSFNLEIVVSITILFVGQYIQQIPRMVRGFFVCFFEGFFHTSILHMPLGIISLAIVWQISRVSMGR